MATDQDVSLASQRASEAVERRDLPAAKAALEELGGLVRTFESVRGRAADPQQREQAEEWLGLARGEEEQARAQVGQLELDMLDPAYEQRARQREQAQAERDEAEKAKAAQFLQGLGEPFAALAGLANLGARPRAAAEEVACPSCQTPNPKRAKFCMECGKPMTRRCAACGAELGRAKFCPECGTRA